MKPGETIPDDRSKGAQAQQQKPQQQPGQQIIQRARLPARERMEIDAPGGQGQAGIDIFDV